MPVDIFDNCLAIPNDPLSILVSWNTTTWPFLNVYGITLLNTLKLDAK